MRNKYFYPIFKLKTKSWIRYWLLKKTEFKGKLSEILTGFSFNLQNTLRQKFVKFEIEGHSEQESTSIADGDEYDSPSPEHEQPIKSAGDNVNKLPVSTLNTTTTNGITFTNNGDGTYSIKGTATANTTFHPFYGTSIDIPTGKDLTMSFYGLVTGMDVHVWEGHWIDLWSNNFDVNNISKSGKFTTASSIVCYINVKNGATVDTTIKPKMEIGTIATPWSPYRMGSITEKITNGDNTEEQTYSIYTQQPMRSIGDVRDVFFKNTVDSPYYDENLVENGWYERHLTYIASYNNEVLPLDVYNEVGGIKYCNEKSMSTTGQFSLGASVQYLDESNWNCLLCTQSQIDILENIPSTFAGQTNVFSEDEVKAFLKIQYWESDTNG